jgi:hypothetical protein
VHELPATGTHLPRGVEALHPRFSRVVLQPVEHLTPHVELELVRGTVSDPHRA